MVSWELLTEFRYDWQQLIILEPTDDTVALAGELAWEYGLCGYDAVHPASALRWQRLMDEPVTLATFERGPWRAADALGLRLFPPDLDALAAR